MAGLNGRDMTEHEAQFYQKKMKAIREALRNGNESKANRHANELTSYFGVE